jgi:hypothetical protein
LSTVVPHRLRQVVLFAAGVQQPLVRQTSPAVGQQVP